MSEILNFFKEKGFKKNGSVYEYEQSDATFGYDAESGMCWIDDGNVYAMKEVKTLDDVKKLYDICNYNLDLKYNGYSEEENSGLNDESYPITNSWLIMSGFEKKGKDKWVAKQGDTVIKYDTLLKKLSLIKGKEGYEGTVRLENQARMIIYEVFGE